MPALNLDEREMGALKAMIGYILESEWKDYQESDYEDSHVYKLAETVSEAIDRHEESR